MSAGSRFASIQSAKDYLVGKIVAEAEGQGISLSNAERGMLYWTEDDLLSPQMLEVNEQLARECDDDAYEAKIGSLVRSLLTQLTRDQQELWDDAVVKISEGDHYLLVLIGAGAAPNSPLPEGLHRWLPNLDRTQPRPKGDRLRLIVFALVLLLIAFVLERLFGQH